ncbi:fatty-acyl-CoA synthase [Sulfobacillus thermosulfidooxidans DSM 9293]|uniref:Fatty-acyl-CoA synthase n=1 Tax=Sulfobacillus thermosulfidooxidans (strain DSM 9293 / VKM B-1269 / AT-1) TaxID=929705 RepID=A0A1W1W8X0_SULTA|nr:fatty acyl-CoA synthetase [Sulfobacillus thermosulfidooxidans]SMC02193.1 fatty-acyl-CoA synthase [Sulfobacillus thermosulfidooxidans DSM 9293]
MHSLIHRHNLYDLLHRSAARYPEKIAVISPTCRLTYREWEWAAKNMAQYLFQQGFHKGDKIAVDARNSAEYATLIFAAAQLGVILVPINFMLSAHEIAYILSHAEVDGIISDREFTERIDRAILLQPDLAPLTHRLFVLIPLEEARGWETFPALSSLASSPSFTDFPVDGPSGDDLAQILYTSGTESRPKGVMLTHSNLIHEYVSVVIDGGFSADDIVLHALPFYHSAQQHVFLGPYTYLGATHVITSMPRPDIILPLIAEERVTEFFAPPTVWISLLRSPLFDQYDLSSLTKGHYGAAIMPKEILLELSRRLPHTQFWNFYGQTEIAPLATVLKPQDQLRKLGSCGQPALNVETILLDEHNHPVPCNEIGEICHRSPHIMPGYYRDPEKTQEVFQGGWFHSGDLGIMDEEGYLTVVDRKKDMIKTGGENVASREVEEVIYQLPGIFEVAVIGVPDPYWIEKVVAVVVLKDGTTMSPSDIIAWCRKHLAPYKVPKEVMIASSLPKNPTGKILKRELRRTISEDPGQISKA